MKKTKVLYWVFTILFTGFMIFSAIPDILLSPEAVAMITGLGYPMYFIVYIGIAKILGSIALLIPGFPRIKEWAYAGLFFDLISATYSQLATAGFFVQVLFMLPPVIIGILSYIFYHKKLRQTTASVA